MKFYNDKGNANDNYSYATFSESIGGRPVFIFKKETFLIIPVLNQGIYDLDSFNSGSETPVYIDRSYYLFKGITECIESLSIREAGFFKGNFENTYRNQLKSESAKPFFIELEMGFNGEFIYGGRWKVKANEFGVIIPDSSRHTLDVYKFFKKIEELTDDEKRFLLNENQTELESFIASL